MFGEKDRPLYVGQTGNLRSRLGSYKNCNPNHTPRKVQRLVHHVERITWELCPDVTQARLRENELLRQHRPKFNSVNTFPKRYFFIGVENSSGPLRLWLTNDPAPDQPIFGAFKGNTRAAFNALVVMLWSYLHAPASHHDFPLGMLDLRRRREITLPASGPARDSASLAIREFLSGNSDHLLEQLLCTVPDGPPVLRVLHEEALAVLAQFYQTGPQRTRRLRDDFQAGSELVLQDRLDDLIVLARRPAPSVTSPASLPTGATPVPTPAASSLPLPS